MLVHDRYLRISAKEALEHSFIQRSYIAGQDANDPEHEEYWQEKHWQEKE